MAQPLSIWLANLFGACDSTFRNLPRMDGEGSTNDECRMSNVERMTNSNDEQLASLGLRHSSSAGGATIKYAIAHFIVVVRHSPLPCHSSFTFLLRSHPP